jgi:formylmethanofuran dehydrogenase subunit E
MTFNFSGLYDFHGHRCPMSTMGARLGVAAMGALGVTKADQFRVEGRFYARNCAIDGIQFVTGCTAGNGNLASEDSGRAAFELRMRDGSRVVTVSVSEAALERLAAHKKKKADLMAEREISGLPRAMEIDGEVKKDFEALVDWVQGAPDEALLTMSGT